MPDHTLSPQTPDVLGRRFGKLSVVAFDGYRGSPTRHAHWRCLCDCGNQRAVRGTSLLRGVVSVCASCALAAAAVKNGTGRQLTQGRAAENALFDSYRRNAEKKGRCFEITLDEAGRLFRSNCRYCGSPPSSQKRTRSRSEPFIYNGIDRRDNRRGYVSDNVVPCCAICNRAKNDLPEDHFVAWIDRIKADA